MNPVRGLPPAGAASELADHHRAMLQEGSGIALAVVAERGCRTIRDVEDLRRLGFSRMQWRVPGLLLPVTTPDGSNGLHVYRPDEPRRDTKRGRDLKYELPQGASVRLDVPKRCLESLKDPTIPLWLTEGQKKADALATRGFSAVALLGVWNYKGQNAFGGVTLLADFDYIALNGRDVRVVFDSDIMHNADVRQALARLTEHLQRKGARVTPVYLPPGTDGSKVGVDDYLLAHAPAELEALVQAAPPAPKAAAPRVELLEDAPLQLRRPLDLINGHAYAATWLWARTTATETERNGNIVRLDPPRVEQKRVLFVVRSDGIVYGPGEAQGLEDLPDSATFGDGAPGRVLRPGPLG